MTTSMKKPSAIEKHPTCGVGDGGAASTGERVMALLANLYKAIAASSCCLWVVEPRSPRSNSSPA